MNHEETIDDVFSMSTFREDPVEQNKLNVQYTHQKAVKDPLSLNDYEKQLLIDNGLDDFVRGGQTQAAGVDAALLAAPLVAKPGLLAGGVTAAGNLIKKYPGKSAEVAATALGGASEDPQDIALETTGFKADTMFVGGRPINTGGLTRILDYVFSEAGSIFNRNKGVTEEGMEIPFMMSKSDDAAKGFSKVTSPEYEKIVLFGMDKMGMKDGVFDLDLYDLNSPILNEMTDTLGGSVMKSGMRRGKKLTKRNWLEYFLTPESLKGNFEALKKEGKVAANQTWEGFLKSKGLKTQAIQAHHINPLYDSIHLFDGVKWGSDEYWEMVTTLIDRGARPGITQRKGITNIIRTLGASARTDTPHGVAHEFYRDIMPTFFSKTERLKMKGNFKYRMEKTRRWAGIVNRSENVVYEAHKAWEALNPEFKISFAELVERMAKYDNEGVLKGIHENYQVPDIKELVKQVQFDEFIARLGIIPSQKQNKLTKRLPLIMDDGTVINDVNQEFLEDLASGMSQRDLNAKWGKKYNLKKINAKQLDFLRAMRKNN